MGNSEFRADIREVVRRHDPDAHELRALAEALEKRADRVEMTNEVI